MNRQYHTWNSQFLNDFYLVTSSMSYRFTFFSHFDFINSYKTINVLCACDWIVIVPLQITLVTSEMLAFVCVNDQIKNKPSAKINWLTCYTYWKLKVKFRDKFDLTCQNRINYKVTLIYRIKAVEIRDRTSNEPWLAFWIVQQLSYVLLCLLQMHKKTIYPKIQ